ncbi:MAG: glycosyltransferase [Aristaeellaceae bacterium]
MNDQQPMVSVIMPCYNDGCYLPETIASLRRQTYDNLELIVIDDGSDDPETLRILQELDFPQLQLLHANRSYPAAARNAGAAAARGEYLLPLDADDLIEPDYIRQAVEVLEKNPDVGAVYCHADLFGDAKGPWGLPDFDVSRMLIDNIVFVTALMRKRVFDEVGGFDATLTRGVEDYDFFLSVLEKGWQIQQLPETLFHYRAKPNSRSRQFARNQEAFFDTYRMLYQKHIALYRAHMESVFPVLREDYLRQKRELADNAYLSGLVYQKGPRAFLRLMYYRYFRRP